MTKKEQLLAEYKKERRRIQSNLKRLRDKGFSAYSKDILPQQPKRITEGSVRRLQKMTTKVIKSKVESFEREKEFERIEKDVIQKPKPVRPTKGKRAKSDKTTYYRDVVSGFIAELIIYPVEVYNTVRQGIKRMIKQTGVDQVGKALLNMPTTFHDMMRIYKSYEEAIENFFGAMADYLQLEQDEREDLEDIIESGFESYD